MPFERVAVEGRPRLMLWNGLTRRIMKLYEITEPKGIDSLKLTERPTPKPGFGEVLVRVRATSLNYRDLAMIKRSLP